MSLTRERTMELLDWAAAGSADSHNCGTCEACRRHLADQDVLAGAFVEAGRALDEREAFTVLMTAIAEMAGADASTRLAIRRAAEGAGSAAEITPAQREFALGVMDTAVSWTTPCDDESAALRERYEALRVLMRGARTAEEFGTALLGGAR